MPSVSFQQCAENYLRGRWVGVEKRFIESMAYITPTLLDDIAASFIISRQFPRRSNVRSFDFEPVVLPLKEALDGIDCHNLVDRVEVMADRLCAVPGLVKRNAAGKPDRPISACSKFIWCGRPDIGVIYDRRARVYLRELGHASPDGDYSAYVRAFRSELSRLDNEIYPVAASYSSVLTISSGQLIAMEWFPAKLLDLWLYSNGTR
ncbi:MAG: hypothetical protein ACT6Q8_24275 [Niveispirillum sp.]|uniref:hypothetical protein n=1 Tax=Niveispirillum sp. TaxID=1917217 RepID=UPI0040363949